MPKADSSDNSRFPQSFLWGAATAAHQVEGDTHNQWSDWEEKNAKSLAAQAEYHYGDLENWDSIKTHAKDSGNYISGKGVDHYNRYEEDFDLLQKMNMNSFRFSVEWSRIEPEEGAWNAGAIEHYKQYITALKKRNIEPILTLFHFTVPVWFADKGGFLDRKNTMYFVRFAEKIVRELGVSVKYIITINEPEVYAFESYYFGHWPPQATSKRQSYTVLRNLAQAHNKAADAIHQLNRRYKVSIAKNSAFVYAGDDALLSRKSAAVAQYFQDDYFLKKIIKKCDYIGVNYYFSNRIYGYRQHNPNERLSDLGWDMSPANLEQALERLWSKYHLPLMITENGLADEADEHRKWWLTQTIVAMQHARKEGVELLGYMHWSLIDNFEWDKGFWPKFGLIAVDDSNRRSLRPSAVWFGSVIKKLRPKD